LFAGKLVKVLENQNISSGIFKSLRAKTLSSVDDVRSHTIVA